jgi:hypothetical protein
LINGQVVTLPNEPLCGAGGLPLPPPQLREPSSARLKIVSPDSGMPIQTADAISPLELAQHLTRFRSPVHGEAHILHRSALRAKDRQVERQHVAEARALGLDGQ